MSQSITAPRIVTLPSDQDASGRTLGAEELSLLAEVIGSGTLTSTKGTFVKTLEERFAVMIGSKHAYACSSGSAAIHIAVAAIDPEPGDEIITSPITDMGALTPILYQGAIPVFADVDVRTCNVTAKTIAARLSNKTRAIIVTHLFGNPCEMEAILALGKVRGIPVIEDSAQSFLARSGEGYVGTIGTIGCFSLQQGKHITTGEGGLVTTDSDALARRMYQFINKAWGYGDSNPDHTFLALNYRMTELQGAVAVAQLEKLHDTVQRRVQHGRSADPSASGLARNRDAVDREAFDACVLEILPPRQRRHHSRRCAWSRSLAQDSWDRKLPPIHSEAGLSMCHLS